jgi:hypothetical protein
MQKLDLKKLDEINIKGIWTIDLGNFKEGYEIKGVISHSKIYSKGAFFSNHFFTFRLLGVAKLLGIGMWLLSALVWAGTIFAIANGEFNIGQLIFCLFFTSLYLLLFRGANKKLINTWETRYTKKINSWLNADISSEEGEFKSDAVVLIENDEVILTNEYVLNQIGDGTFNDFLKLMDDISDSVVEKMKEHKKEEEKKKKEYEKKEFSAAFSDLKDIAGEALSEHIKDRQARGLVDRNNFIARGVADSLGESAARKRAEGNFANKMDDLEAEEKKRREKDSIDLKDVIDEAKKKHQDD